MSPGYFDNYLWEKRTYSKVIHVRDENSSLDDSGQGRASLLENDIQILAALSRLLGDGALDQSAISSKGDLARAVNGSGSLDGLRLEVIQDENDVFQLLIHPLKAREVHNSHKGRGLGSRRQPQLVHR